MHLGVMEISLLIMENHGIVFLNFCGNLVNCIELFFWLVQVHGCCRQRAL